MDDGEEAAVTPRAHQRELTSTNPHVAPSICLEHGWHMRVHNDFSGRNGVRTAERTTREPMCIYGVGFGGDGTRLSTDVQPELQTLGVVTVTGPKLPWHDVHGPIATVAVLPAAHAPSLF